MKDGDSTQPATDTGPARQIIASFSFPAIQLANIPNLPQILPVEKEKHQERMGTALETPDHSSIQLSFPSLQLAHSDELPQTALIDEALQAAEAVSQSMPIVPETPQSTPKVNLMVIPDTPQPLWTTPEEHGAKWRRVLSRRGVLVGGATAAFVLTVGGLALDMLLHPGLTRDPRPSRPPAGPKKLIPGVPLFSLIGRTDSVQCTAWSPTGLYLVTAGRDRHVMLWDIASYLQQGPGSLQAIHRPRQAWKFSNQLTSNAICWSADGSTIAAVVMDDHRIHLLDAFGNTTTSRDYEDAAATSAGHPPTYAAISWSPTTNTFAAAALLDGVAIDLWQTFNPTRPMRRLTLPGSNDVAIVETAWSADGALLAALTSLGTVLIWEVSTGKVQQVITLSGSTPTAMQSGRLAWSPIDPRLLAISYRHSVTVWDVLHNKLLLTLKTEELPARSLVGLTWSPNGKYLAGCYEGSRRIYVWNAQLTGHEAALGAERLQMFFFPRPQDFGHSKAITDVQWSLDGRYIASTSSDAMAIVWKVDGV